MRPMNWLRVSLWLVAAVPLMGGQCVPVPELKEKTVEIALGAAVSAQFDAEGLINTYNETVTVDIADSLDLREILIGAGIDPVDVRDVKMAGAAYRMVEPDPSPDRQIVGGGVSVRRQGGSDAVLIASFTETVNEVVNFETAPLNADGVEVINGLLYDLLVEVQTGVPAPNTSLSITVTGQSVPTDVRTDFRWELKIYFSIMGVVEVEVVEF